MRQSGYRYQRSTCVQRLLRPHTTQRASDPSPLPSVTAAWLTVAAFRRLRCLQERRARMVLAEWEAEWRAYDADPAAHPVPSVPRVRRVPGRRGPPSLQVLAEDVAALYALDVADVHQLAA